jgi:hypothetical protein
VLPSPAAWLCLAHRDAPAVQGHSGCTGTLQLYRDASAGQVPGTKVAAGGKMGPASTSSQVDRRQVHLDFGPDSNRRYLLSDIRPCLAIRPCSNSIACVQTSYKTMVIYCRFYGRWRTEQLNPLIKSSFLSSFGPTITTPCAAYFLAR